ncbi:spore germination protein [Gorillibacterium sp. CAU 1737]|uniref:spore germination protein n=1 Tax=Gorillibacterium sp. CAU 1737 TaxID=3140362 RepID=UPI0032615A0B
MEPFQLSPSLDENLRLVKERFSGDKALHQRILILPFEPPVPAALLYLDGLTNIEQINRFVVEPLLQGELAEIGTEKRMQQLLGKIIVHGQAKCETQSSSLILSLLSGDTLLLVDGETDALVMEAASPLTRPIQEPDADRLVRGPREGFTESLSINLALLRKRIKQPELKFRYMEIGERTHTKVCISYLEDVVSEKILQEVFRRLEAIEIDGILDSGYLQELIKDAPLSPFETIGYSERPDAIAGKLLEGRIAIFVDGSPAVLTVPHLFVEYFQVSGDYYANYFTASFNRFLRFLGGLLSISVPAIYVALVTYNQEMIPTPLLLSISASRMGIPFPTVLEAVLMIVIFEILREAGKRIPAPIGQTVSIVGALVLGQAAVNARIVSAPMVIVVALTGISGLLTVRLQGPVFLFRFLFLGLGAFMGLYGYLFGLIGLLLHLMSIRSFGVIYMEPLHSIGPESIGDTIIRAPWWDMTVRMKRIAYRNRIRQNPGKGGSRHGPH